MIAWCPLVSQKMRLALGRANVASFQCRSRQILYGRDKKDERRKQWIKMKKLVWKFLQANWEKGMMCKDSEPFIEDMWGYRKVIIPVEGKDVILE